MGLSNAWAKCCTLSKIINPVQQSDFAPSNLPTPSSKNSCR